MELLTLPGLNIFQPEKISVISSFDLLGFVPIERLDSRAITIYYNFIKNILSLITAFGLLILSFSCKLI